MPCNTVQTNTVELKNVKNHSLLERALKAQFGEQSTHHGAGRFTFMAEGQWVTIDGGVAKSRLDESVLQEVVGRVKQAYSRKAVATAAKRFGWAVNWTDANNFTVKKG